MTSATKPRPTPDSKMMSARARRLCGTTSPRPSVNRVVPLTYRSVPNCAQALPVCRIMTSPNGRTHGEIKHREAGDQQKRPEQQKQKKRKRAIDAVDLLAHLLVAGALGHHDPWCPGSDEEETGDLKSTGRTARQNDGLKRVEGHPQATEQSGNECGNVHEKSSIQSEVAIFVNLTRALRRPFRCLPRLSKSEGYDHSVRQDSRCRMQLHTPPRHCWSQRGQILRLKNIVFSFDKDAFSGLS